MFSPILYLECKLSLVVCKFYEIHLLWQIDTIDTVGTYVYPYLYLTHWRCGCICGRTTSPRQVIVLKKWQIIHWNLMEKCNEICIKMTFFNGKCALSIVVCDILPIFLMMRVLSSYLCWNILSYVDTYPHSKVHGANMGPTWVLSAPYGPHVGPVKLTIRVS